MAVGETLSGQLVHVICMLDTLLVLCTGNLCILLNLIACLVLPALFQDDPSFNEHLACNTGFGEINFGCAAICWRGIIRNGKGLKGYLTTRCLLWEPPAKYYIFFVWLTFCYWYYKEMATGQKINNCFLLHIATFASCQFNSNNKSRKHKKNIRPSLNNCSFRVTRRIYAKPPENQYFLAI